MDHNDALYRLQQDLHLRRCSQSTERIYTRETRLFLSFCGKPAQELTEEDVLDYLGRYTHRVAISNNRILSLEDGKVTFRWRDYSDGNKVKRMTLDAEEFIRRYLLHVLPKEFRKLRHYGLYAPRNKQDRLKLCRRLTGTPAPEAAMPVVKRLRKLFGKDFDLCPCCKVGHLSREPPVGRTA